MAKRGIKFQEYLAQQSGLSDGVGHIMILRYGTGPTDSRLTLEGPRDGLSPRKTTYPVVDLRVSG